MRRAMTAAEKKAFLKRMAAGRQAAGGYSAGTVSDTMHPARGGMGALNADEARAVQDFAARKGRTWKSELSAQWMRAEASPILMRLRNRLGPAWLKGLKLPKAAGRVKSAGKLRTYVVEDERTERVLGTYRADSPAKAITACMARHPGHSRAYLSAHVMPSKAGRVTGRKVTRKGARKGAKRHAGATAIVHAPAILPKRKGHARGMVGGGSESVRLHRVETAVQDLAKASHAIVGKLVDHEQRLNHVESTLSTWAKGRR